MIQNNKGFSLIELMITVLIITVLASIALPAYVGISGRAKNARVVSNAERAKNDLYLWLQSSRSDKINNREVDTDFNGIIDVNDKTNGELVNKVDILYVSGRNSALGEMSPWFNRQMWNSNDPPIAGTISIKQVSPGQLKVIATEKNGIIISEYSVSVD
jgi:prepilin-type N-terminal cleavage/methylation domain-containing protein